MAMCLFKKEFSQEFGAQIGLLQPTVTRWNSTLTHINSFISKDLNALNRCLEKSRQEIRFTARDWAQLEELSKLLQPFLEATQKTQGEEVQYISTDFDAYMLLMRKIQKSCCFIQIYSFS